MAPGLKSSAVALIIALILAGPAYWAGYHAATYLMRRETEEYRVWQESYHIDRRFYEAISKNPPPRYLAPPPWQGYAGGGVAVVVILGLTLFGITRPKPGSGRQIADSSKTPAADSE